MVVLTRRVELAVPPDTLTVEGLRETDNPVAGGKVVDKTMDPANPLSPLVITVELLDVPANRERVPGFVEIEKSSADNFQPVTGWISQCPDAPLEQEVAGLVPQSKYAKPWMSKVTDELVIAIRGGAHPGVAFQSWSISIWIVPVASKTSPVWSSLVHPHG